MVRLFGKGNITSMVFLSPTPLNRLTHGPVAKAAPTLPEQIAALAAKLEPGLAKAVLAYLTKQQDAVTLEALLAAVTTGNIGNIEALLATADTAAEAAGIRDALQDAIHTAGAVVAGSVPRLHGVTFTFNRLSPLLTQWLQGYSLNLIREMDRVTLAGIRTALQAGNTAGQSPIGVARDVRQGIGLTQRQQQAVANYRTQLESWHTRTSASGFNLGGKISRRNGRQTFAIDADGNPLDKIFERRLRDFRFDGQLQTALSTGKALTPAQIDKMVAAYQRKYLRYRSEMIARTEAVRTNNAGIQEAWRQAIEKGQVTEASLRRYWKVADGDERLCNLCRPIPIKNKEGVLFAAPFSTDKGAIMLPPAHPACRCVVFITIKEQ
jgi:hypothetical protein